MMMTRPCKGCGAELIWRRTPAGQPMPLDADPLPAYAPGSYVITDDIHCRPAEPLLDAGTPMYLNHFATCSAADMLRRKP